MGEHKEGNEGANLPFQSLELRKALEPKLISNASILEVDKDWGNKLWDAIKTTQGQKGSIDAEPPIEEIDFDQKTLGLEIRSEYGEADSEISHESKAETLKTLPSYLGEYEAKSKVKKYPTADAVS